MARASMAELISLVRDLIGDPAGAEQTFSDDQIERSLDFYRWEYRGLPLKPLNTVIGGSIQYRDWYSEEQYWEADAGLYDGAHSQLTPASADALHGRWSFAADQPTVLVSGKVYDPYGAAADLLEMWVGKAALEFDVDADGTNMKRSQKQQALRALAEHYRKHQRIITAQQVRNDIF